jgi:hypothetical protein
VAHALVRAVSALVPTHSLRELRDGSLRQEPMRRQEWRRVRHSSR